MSQIKITPIELVEQAKVYQYSAETIRDVLHQLQHKQQEIEQNWEGKAWSRYEEQFYELVPLVEQFSEVLLNIQKQLEKAAATMADVDNDIANMFGL